MNKLILKWKDKQGKNHEKEYDHKTIRKAQKWLIDNGATEVDIAVRLPKPPEPDISKTKEGTFGGSENNETKRPRI